MSCSSGFFGFVLASFWQVSGKLLNDLIVAMLHDA